MRSRYNSIALLLILVTSSVAAQNFTSYITGYAEDVVTTPLFGIALAGGASDSDPAMQWFLERANGGDVLVLRASGSDGYNDYFYSELGITVNSVETIVCHNGDASYDSYVLQRIQEAEAIFIAGGDQWNYVSYWRDTPVEDALNHHMLIKQAPIGGTSAGMAMLGGHYFMASNGTVYSDEALQDPFNTYMTIGHHDFLQTPFLEHVITDTHYDDPDRRGRHVSFLARIYADGYPQALGIACEEYTCVCIDENGTARVFGEYPEYDDFAYFIRHGCENPWTPEVCESGQPLNWVNNEKALYAWKTTGTLAGENTFQLTDWEAQESGEWQEWWVTEGMLQMNTTSLGPWCPLQNINHVDEPDVSRITLYPNPTREFVHAIFDSIPQQIRIMDTMGQVHGAYFPEQNSCVIDLKNFASGTYCLWITYTSGNTVCTRFVVE